MTTADLLKDYWYYSVELTPGQFTPGEDHTNVIATRALLARLKPAGRDVLDIGTMEGLVPVLLNRRGAKVTAVDALDLSAKVGAVRTAHGVWFDYHPCVAMGELVAFLRNKHRTQAFMGHSPRPRGYDVVVCSGVLYHTFGFFEALGACRTLLRPGGRLVLETAVSLRRDLSLVWNFHGSGWYYGGGSNTWFVTAPLLDHFLRLLRMRIVDVARVGPAVPDAFARLALVAETTEDLLATPEEAEGDTFALTTRNLDYNTMFDAEFAQGFAPAGGYSAPLGLPMHAGLNAVDLHAAAMTLPGLEPDPERSRLRLSDRT